MWPCSYGNTWQGTQGGALKGRYWGLSNFSLRFPSWCGLYVHITALLAPHCHCETPRRARESHAAMLFAGTSGRVRGVLWPERAIWEH